MNFYEWFEKTYPGVELYPFQIAFIKTVLNKEKSVILKNSRQTGKLFVDEKLKEYFNKRLLK